jgi:hypothetical protein
MYDVACVKRDEFAVRPASRHVARIKASRPGFAKNILKVRQEALPHALRYAAVPDKFSSASECRCKKRSGRVRAVIRRPRFISVDVEEQIDLGAAAVAAAIGEPARARMLYSLVDNCARTTRNSP